MAMGYGRTWRFRKKPSIGWIISGIVGLGLSILVGNRILTVVGTVIGNITNTPFYSALSFLGMADTGGTWSTNALVGVLGLVAVASFVLSVVKISLKGTA